MKAQIIFALCSLGIGGIFRLLSVCAAKLFAAKQKAAFIALDFLLTGAAIAALWAAAFFFNDGIIEVYSVIFAATGFFALSLVI